MKIVRSSERLLACCSAAAHRVSPGFASSEPLKFAMSHLSQHCTTAYMQAVVSVYDPIARSAVPVCPTLQVFAIRITAGSGLDHTEHRQLAGSRSTCQAQDQYWQQHWPSSKLTPGDSKKMDTDPILRCALIIAFGSTFQHAAGACC